MLPPSAIKPRSRFTKDHKSITLKNGSVFNWVTNEQGWKAMRGPESDIFVMDEENDKRVFDEIYRGLRNAKGGWQNTSRFNPSIRRRVWPNLDKT